MHRARSNHLLRRSGHQGAALALLCFMACSTAVFAQEPPLDVPKGGPLTKATDTLAAGGWLLYPQLRGFGLWSDNLFQSSTNPISTAGYGIAPSLVMERTNGIHTTTLYGNLERRIYPHNEDINTFDRQAGFTQRYEALRDLNFRFQGDYTHKTNAQGLISAIPDQVVSPGSTILPNGNTVLPNGNIIDPQGNVVGQTNPRLTVVGANNTVVNPYDKFTGTASIEKYFNRGIVTVLGSFSRTEYETTVLTPDYNSKTLNGSGGFWLGPLFYVYSNALLAWNDFAGSSTEPASSTSAYRAVAGIGTARIGLLRGVVYAGHQGSKVQSGTAGGDIYGGRLTYDPTRDWTLSASVEQVTNIASIGTVSNLAQTDSTPTPIVISTGSSTRKTATFLASDYAISKQWSVLGRFGYTRVEYLNSTQLDNAWLADVVLRYEMLKNLTLTWEYQYTSIVSNAPLTSSQRNYVIGSATYRF